MSGPKTEFNNQWGRTAVDGGDPVPATQTPASASNNGKEPLVDLFGRPWVRVAAPIAPATAETAVQTFKLGGNVIPVGLASVIAGKVYRAEAYNADNNDHWLQLFDSASLPVNADLPTWQAFVMKGEGVTLPLTELGAYFGSGLGIALSTTPNLLTLPTADDYWMHALFFNQ